MRVKRGQDRRGRGLAGMIGSMLLMMAAILFFTLFSVQFAASGCLVQIDGILFQ